MALGTYTELQASIADWLDRTDLTSVIPDFIALFEANANTEAAIRTLFNRTSTSIPTVANQNYISTPTDFLAPESYIYTSSGNKQVVSPYGTSAALYAAFPSTTGGPPKGLISLNGKLELAPVPDSAYTGTLYYYSKIPALASNSTNWLLTNYPQVYLFGSLLAAEAYLQNDPRLPVWGSMYDNAIQKLQGSTDRNKYAGPVSVKFDAVV